MALRSAFDSLAVRVIGLSSVWALAAFLVVGGFVSSVYETTAVSGLRSVVSAHLYSLVNSVSVNENDILTGAPDLGDLSYARPLSGWYWEVTPVGGNTLGRLSSFSLGPGRIPSPSTEEAPFDIQYRRAYTVPGLDGETLHVEEAEIVLEPGDHAARFRVMGNASVVEADIHTFNRTMALYLGLFALGSILINALAILYGLRPLKRVRRALGDVRAGKAERLAGRFPTEIRPLASEMNALIDNNRRVVERARTQVGNLAHSLKTPIAVLMNEAGAIGGEKGRLVGAEAQRMRTQVQHYLDRARIAAQREGSIVRTKVEPSLERLVTVVERLNRNLDVELLCERPEELVFAGEREDLEEMVGNLLENAAKWGRSRILVRAGPLEDERLYVAVEDDGPGLSQTEMGEAMKRGRRLDEAMPGSGLGLSIVSDAIAQYRGEFRLSRSLLGGLKAEAVLPRASGGNIS